MRVLHVCSELFPLLKTGGLADVTGSLPMAQITEGADVRLLMPAFPALMNSITETNVVVEKETFAGHVTLRYGIYQGVGIYLIDVPHLYNRPGSPYHDSAFSAYGDNHLRFALLGWIASELACGMDYFWQPEIVHAHDWHAGLACAYIADRGYPAKTVFTVHNLAYQGLFSSYHLGQLHLAHLSGVEFYGQISYLKAGLCYANHVTTVSPTYAQEITRPEYGFGMDGLLRDRQYHGGLMGILNGVDYTIWNPAKDKQVNHSYTPKKLQGKVKNKARLQTELGLKVTPDVPLFVVVSRLSHQKGLDLLVEAIPEILKAGGQLALLGSGELALEQVFTHLANQHPEQISVTIGYDEAFSHRLIAGGDVIVVPSRFEPCGLTQLYGLKYGTLPLVRHTGGLADTVVDCSLENLADNSATGFVFNQSNVIELRQAIRRVFALWSWPGQWQVAQQKAMSLDFSWAIAAKTYLSLYTQLR